MIASTEHNDLDGRDRLLVKVGDVYDLYGRIVSWSVVNTRGNDSVVSIVAKLLDPYSKSILPPNFTPTLYARLDGTNLYTLSIQTSQSVDSSYHLIACTIHKGDKFFAP